MFLVGYRLSIILLKLYNTFYILLIPLTVYLDHKLSDSSRYWSDLSYKSDRLFKDLRDSPKISATIHILITIVTC